MSAQLCQVFRLFAAGYVRLPLPVSHTQSPARLLCSLAPWAGHFTGQIRKYTTRAIKGRGCETGAEGKGPVDAGTAVSVCMGEPSCLVQRANVSWKLHPILWHHLPLAVTGQSICPAREPVLLPRHITLLSLHSRAPAGLKLHQVHGPSILPLVLQKPRPQLQISQSPSSAATERST